MSGFTTTSERIIVVGGGFAGLSAAARLAHAGYPVTVFEASKLGHAASTRNQGWLYSGASFAKENPQLAGLCYEAFQQTMNYCPECIEPDIGSMIYFSLTGETDKETWTSAWTDIGIPFYEIPEGELVWDLPQVNREKIRWTLRLPDRSFRPDVLLESLAATAIAAGVEIRSGTCVTDLLMDERKAFGVRLGANEEVRSRFIVLATGASSCKSFFPLFKEIAGRQSDYQLVSLKMHLSAVHPSLAIDPFYQVDDGGLNHLPHEFGSVFGTGHWEVVSDPDDHSVNPDEIEKIDKKLEALLPGGIRGYENRKDWAGTAVQAMHLEQIVPGIAPLPTIIHHAQQPCGVENVVSLFPGRATLWPQLADSLLDVVREQFPISEVNISSPPWLFTS